MALPVDAAFDAWVDEARAISVLEVIERRGIGLRRSGTEWMGPCPVCGGTDRFGASVRKGVWVCRGSGRGGDAIALVQYLDDADFLGACEILTGRPPARGEGTRASAEDLARRAEDRREKEAYRAREADRYRERERRFLYGQWQQAVRAPAAPTLAAYLARRGVVLPPRCASLRFMPAAPYFHGQEQDERGRMRARMVHRGPAMVAAITDADGVFSGLHTTWIDLAATKGKAEILDPATGELLPAKKVRGHKAGCRILLVPAEGAPLQQMAGEGIESVLSVWVALARAGGVQPDTEFVSAIDLGNLTGRAAEQVPHPSIRTIDAAGRARVRRVPGPVADMDSPAMCVPDTVRTLTLLADGDSDPFATRCAMERAQARHAIPGHRWVSVAWPPEGMDFNDLLRSEAA